VNSPGAGIAKVWASIVMRLFHPAVREDWAAGLTADDSPINLREAMPLDITT